MSYFFYDTPLFFLAEKVTRNDVLTSQNMEKARQELSILQENIDLSVKRKQTLSKNPPKNT